MEMTMSDKATNRGKPKIVIGDVDHERLTSLATGALDRMPEVADILLSELERAKVVKARSVPADTIQMGSTIEYRPDDGQHEGRVGVHPSFVDTTVARPRFSITSTLAPDDATTRIDMI